MTQRLAALASQVVGLDASAPMLAQTRNRHHDSAGIRFICADYRGFDLGQRFDAAVCAGNSLNYVTDIDELSAVLTQVARHLKAGGLFLFDTFTHDGMYYLSGKFIHVEIEGRRFALSFNYDRRRRQETSLAILPIGIETHRRIPIDPKDVLAAVQRSGLEVEDYFSRAMIPGWWFPGMYCLFVLRKKA